MWCTVATSSAKKRSAVTSSCSASTSFSSAASTVFPRAAAAFAPSELRLLPIRPTMALAALGMALGPRHELSALGGDECERRERERSGSRDERPISRCSRISEAASRRLLQIAREEESARVRGRAPVRISWAACSRELDGAAAVEHRRAAATPPSTVAARPILTQISTYSSG